MTKKYGLYPGCIMPTEQYAYELSTRSIFKTLGIDLVDLPNISVSTSGEVVRVSY